jgi:hypothetical protein
MATMGNFVESLIPIFAIFCSVALPIGLVFFAVARNFLLQKHRLELAMAERRLLIEQGVTDLPPLRLSDLAVRRANPYRTLTWGVILLALALGTGLGAYLYPDSAVRGVQGAPLILGFLGLALLAIHFLVRYYEKQDRPSEQADSQDAKPQGLNVPPATL